MVRKESNGLKTLSRTDMDSKENSNILAATILSTIQKVSFCAVTLVNI